jgi:methionyl-tRNA formyltransferase
VFLGTPHMAVPPLRALVDAGFDVALVVTRPDKRRGRGSATAPSPVKVAATDLGLPVTSKVDDALDTGAELGVVVAYGALIKPHVLERLPMINVHFSLLPRWRGAAPVERAVLAGDARTGVAVMQLEEGLDTGPVYASAIVPIRERATADALRAELVTVGTALLVDTLREGLGHAHPQEGEATYAAKITLADLHLDWSRPAAELDRVVRVGGAWTTFRGRRLKVLEASPVDGITAPGRVTSGGVGTGAGLLRVQTVQPEGRAAMTFDAWRNGAHLTPDDVLGS